MRTRLVALLSTAACFSGCSPCASQLRAAATAPAPTSEVKPDPALGYSLEGTGDLHDFDTFAGAWSFQNWRLKQRGVGSTEWDEFPATSCTTLYLGGGANVDEVVFPTKGWSGLTVRTFHKEKRQWSIYWVNSRDGAMYPPVVGGFAGDTGDFFGPDTDDGRPVLVRFHWTRFSPDHLKWEQSFSYDGRSWETNWINELQRVDEATTCDHGRPRPQP
jgi:hypothetical protein